DSKREGGNECSRAFDVLFHLRSAGGFLPGARIGVSSFLSALTEIEPTAGCSGACPPPPPQAAPEAISNNPPPIPHRCVISITIRAHVIARGQPDRPRFGRIILQRFMKKQCNGP